MLVDRLAGFNIEKETVLQPPASPVRCIEPDSVEKILQHEARRLSKDFTLACCNILTVCARAAGISRKCVAPVALRMFRFYVSGYLFDRNVAVCSLDRVPLQKT